METLKRKILNTAYAQRYIKTIFKKCIYDKFRKQIYSFTCILPDYVALGCPNFIWKIAILTS